MEFKKIALFKRKGDAMYTFHSEECKDGISNEGCPGCKEALRKDLRLETAYDAGAKGEEFSCENSDETQYYKAGQEGGDPPETWTDYIDPWTDV